MRDNGATREPLCAECKVQACLTKTTATEGPAYCPTEGYDELVAQVRAEATGDPNLHKLALAAARTEVAGYMKWTRVQETVEFAHRIGARKIGIATCVGLIREAALASKIFRKHGLKVASVCCKVGAVDKTEFGLAPDERIHQGSFEAICMPLAQAEILNRAQTDLNVLIGLCVGHDALFFKRSTAPVTVLIAKDRVTGHNPAAALYTSHFYYRKLLEP